MKIVSAKREFHSVSEEEVLAALDDTSPTNPIAHEVARLIEEYTKNFCLYVERTGRIPEATLRVAGSCPIEEVAMKLTADTIRSSL